MGPFTTPTNYQFSNSNSIWTFKRLLKAFLRTTVLGWSINKVHFSKANYVMVFDISLCSALLPSIKNAINYVRLF